MDPAILAEKLKEAAEALGVEVRSCPAESEGGAAVLKGKRVVFVPEGAHSARRAALVAEALAPLDLEGVYLLPAVRDEIERARTKADHGGTVF